MISFEIPVGEEETFRYRQGQYLSLQVEIDGEKFKREYSICSSPYSNEDLAIAVKSSATGTVSKYLRSSIKPGDTILTYPPNGKFFTELNPANSKTYILIGGGSGVTPLFSILKSVLTAEPESRVILYSGNSTEQSIMFYDDLKLIKSENSNLTLLFTLTRPGPEWNGLQGHISKDEIGKLVTGVNDPDRLECFVCGPNEMMRNSEKALLSYGVPADRIHIEYFTPPPVPEVYMPEGVPDVEDIERKVKIIINDEAHAVLVPPGGVILDAAIDADLDPPFSCRSGICTTCRAKLRSGKVKMDEREGLKDEEIEEGYVLTCQSHPLTDDVTVEYM